MDDELIIKQSKACLIIFVFILIIQCENKERFYRPDLPEQICAIGLIDLDDTLSYNICKDTIWPAGCPTCWVDSLVTTKKIYFEKSFQSEYTDGTTYLFKEFQFKVSNDQEDLFVYNHDEPIKDPVIKIPADIKFESGRKYFFHIREIGASGISAECITPSLPPSPYLVTLKTGIDVQDLPKEGCYYWVDSGTGQIGPPHYKDITTYYRRYAEIEFSFLNSNPESYYTIFLIGSPPAVSLWDRGPGHFASNFLNYKILETNTDGFFHAFKGGVTVQHFCQEVSPHSYTIGCKTDTLSTYFIDGSKIPGGTLTMKILVQWDDVQYIPSYIEYFRVRLMSMPKEAYLFYKSLYTYKMERDDPFAELININGNIVGGNGIIALCRSRDLIIYTGQKGGMYDPFF